MSIKEQDTGIIVLYKGYDISDYALCYCRTCTEKLRKKIDSGDHKYKKYTEEKVTQ